MPSWNFFSRNVLHNIHLFKSSSSTSLLLTRCFLGAESFVPVLTAFPHSLVTSTNVIILFLTVFAAFFPNFCYNEATFERRYQCFAGPCCPPCSRWILRQQVSQIRRYSMEPLNGVTTQKTMTLKYNETSPLFFSAYFRQLIYFLRSNNLPWRFLLRGFHFLVHANCNRIIAWLDISLLLGLYSYANLISLCHLSTNLTFVPQT
jgi:hypothetical protein